MLLVYGPRSATYDFGPSHPLTPRRFGPGLDLLRAVGATPGLEPEPAPDAELAWCHDAAYIEVVKRFSASPFGPPQAGIGGGGDDPPFAGMHDAAAMVAGGSIRALEAILRGEVEHSFHPGGGLHHAMPGRASGFCIYDDVALAVARARRDGLRVLYIDLDVHHGDGVQAIHWDDPGVMTVSIHESGMTLFPGSGFADETGEGVAAGTSVNVPLAAGTGERVWLETLRTLLPELAAAFGPDLVVSQHGADSHAWDPLAHLRITTTAMGEAAKLVDEIAHRYARGRWLATGGGGYDAYRVVPRMWSLVWLAGAHRDVPIETPPDWRERWATEGARYGQAPLPRTFDDAPNAGLEVDSAQKGAETASTATARAVRRALVPRLLREARDRGWWDPLAPADGTGGPDGNAGTAEVIDTVDRAAWESLALAPRVIAPADARHGHALIAAALDDGAHVSAAVVPSATGSGGIVVGAAVASADGELLALGVAPDHRRQGLAGRLLAASRATLAEVTVAERDPIDPLDRVTRAAVARALLGVGVFHLGPADRDVRAVDPLAIRATR
jgi:acetoin utilization protein AcuC